MQYNIPKSFIGELAVVSREDIYTGICIKWKTERLSRRILIPVIFFRVNFLWIRDGS